MSVVGADLSTSAANAGPKSGATLSVTSLERGFLWLFMATSSLAFIEPAPHDVLFIPLLGLFAVLGLKLSRRLMPLALLLILFNVGGVAALVPYFDDDKSVRFVAVSVYLLFYGLFFAILMLDDAGRRLDIIRSGTMFAGWIAAIAGVIGYFDIGGLGQFFTLNDRASGTFKDPNVLGPFLVLSIAYVLHRVITGEIGVVRAFVTSSLPIFTVFLSFSRGAWGNLIGALGLLVFLMFLTSDSARLRQRIIIMTAAGLALAAAALLIALSFEDIGEMFQERASLNQSYDLGETGRFGNQLRSIPLLLEAPNGFGPLRFQKHFPEDPHNVYINAFASYGWLGGFTYAALVLATSAIGWPLVLRRTPLHRHVIVIWSVLFVTILQGFQIDTDHWRHFFMMLGLIWGIAALPESRAGT